MNVFQKIGASIARPSSFYDEVNGEGLGPAFGYLALVQLIFFVLIVPTIILIVTLVKILPFFPYEFAVGPMPQFVLNLLLGSLGAYILGLLFSFIIAAIVHVWSLLFGAVGDYADSYKALVYGSTPFMIFGWIPGLNVLVELWAIVLVAFGLARLHHLSAVRVVLMVLIPIIVFGGGIPLLLWLF